MISQFNVNETKSSWPYLCVSNDSDPKGLRWSRNCQSTPEEDHDRKRKGEDCRGPYLMQEDDEVADKFGVRQNHVPDSHH